MSFRFFRDAWSRAVPGRHAGAKLVLISLADQANERGEAWPSQTHISQRTGLSTRRVRSNLKLLATLGLITITHRRNAAGAQVSSLYRLVPPPSGSAQIISGGGPLPAVDVAKVSAQNISECDSGSDK